MKQRPNFKFLILATLAGLAGGVVGGTAIVGVVDTPQEIFITQQAPVPISQTRTVFPPGTGDALNQTFTSAAAVSLPSVVYIECEVQKKSADFWYFGDLWGNQSSKSSGSGVIISEDGYVVTNHHVIEDAKIIQISGPDSKKYTAKVIGKDKNTDLALVKIEAKGLKPIRLADSDKLQIGEWVLAVGNPFSLTNTVTSGIVSAKGRNIHIVEGSFPIESFIQTDAAINPGNSGGALVNLNGELVGINTAIFSKTGSYTGYGFAIPSNIVQKVVADIKQFGTVQRGFIGADVRNYDPELDREERDANVSGVVLRSVYEGGPASKAGLEPGDVITRIDTRMINGQSDFDEMLAYKRPGDKVEVEYLRGKETRKCSIVLTNVEGTTEILKKSDFHSDQLGADFGTVSKLEKDKLGIEGGVRVTNIGSGKMSQMGIPEGFIITRLNGSPIVEPEEVISVLENAKGKKITIEGVTPKGQKSFYSFFLY